MIPAMEIPRLTERQMEVLSIVVENKIYKKKDTMISELSERLGIEPRAVFRHLQNIEKSSLLKVAVFPSPKGERAYERLKLEPMISKRRVTTEALSDSKKKILAYFSKFKDITVTELADELGLNEQTLYPHLRVLEAIGLIKHEFGRSKKRGAPHYVYNITQHGRNICQQWESEE